MASQKCAEFDMVVVQIDMSTVEIHWNWRDVSPIEIHVMTFENWDWSDYTADPNVVSLIRLLVTMTNNSSNLLLQW